MKIKTLDDILTWIIMVGLFAVPFIPILVTSSLFFPFITGKGFAFRIIVEVITALWLILAIRKAEFRPVFSRIWVALSIFLGVMLLADIFAVNPFKSFWSNFERMEGFFLLLHLYAFFLVLSSMFKQKEWWNRYFHTWIGTGVFIGFYSILQLQGELAINQGGVRIDATFGNATYLAVFLLFVSFLSLFYAVRAKEENRSYRYPLLSLLTGSAMFIILPFTSAAVQSRAGEGSFWVGPWHLGLYIVTLIIAALALYAWRKAPALKERTLATVTYVLYGLYALLFVVLLYFTATRGVTLGFIAGILVSTIIVAIFERKNIIMRKIAIGLLVALALLIGGFLFLRGTDFIEKSPVLSRFSSISLKEGSTRFMIWNIAWQGVKERPILGWGQEGFNFVFNAHYNPKLYSQEPWFDRTHNVFFDWLIAGGFLGLIAYLSLFFFAFYYLWDRHTRGAFSAWKERLLSFFRLKQKGEMTFSVTERAILSGLLVGYFFQNMFVFDNLVSYLLFFSVLAFIHGTVGVEHSKIDKVFTRAQRSDRNYAIAVSVVICVGLISMYYVNIKGIATGRTLIQALIPQEEGLPKNLNFFRQALAYNVTGHQEVVEQLALATTQIQSTNAPDVLKKNFSDAAEKAINDELLRVPRDARIWMFKGSLMHEIGKEEEAVRSFTRAHELTPQKQTPLLAIGTGLLGQGKAQEALPYLKEAYELAPGFWDARYLYAIGAAYAKNFDLAESLIREENGEYTNVDNRIVQPYANAGEFDRIIPILESVIKSGSATADTHIALAVAYLNVGKRQQAIAELEIVKTLRPEAKDQFDYYISEIRAGRNP